MGKLVLRIKSSRAKLLGTLVSITGALIVTLYKGSPITAFTSSSDHNSLHQHLGSSPSTWIIGGLLLALACFFLSLLYIVQTWTIRDYPEELVVTVICCIFVTIQSAIVCLIAERNPKAWKLRFNMELISIGYAAVFMTVLRSIVHTWACRKEGPVYTAMFKPLGLVIAIAMGVSILGDTLYLGRLFGAVVITLGFYSLIRGQAMEHKTIKGSETICTTSDSSSHEAPLLQGKTMQV